MEPTSSRWARSAGKLIDRFRSSDRSSDRSSGGPSRQSSRRASDDDIAPPPDSVDAPAPVSADDPVLLDGDGSIDLERQAQDGPPTWLRVIGGGWATAAFVLLLGGFALVVLRQTLGVLADIERLPQWAQWASYAGLSVLLLLLTLAAGRLVLSFAKLRSTPALSIRAIRELEQRRETRASASVAIESAAGQLETLLVSYPTRGRAIRRLRRAGLKAEDLSALEAKRSALLTARPSTDAAEWVERFRDEFLPLIEGPAKRVIRRRAMLAGAKTAALPRGLLDTAVMLGHTTLLIGDLCVLYNLRTSGAGTVAILWRVLFASLVASQAEEFADEAANQLGSALSEASSNAVTRAGAAVAGRLVGKAGEGLVNAMLVYRLGRATMNRLSPLG